MKLLPPGRLGSHLVTADALAELDLHTGGAGLVLGVNQHGEPVTLRLFRPEPTRIVVVGGLRFGQLLAFRALALGAQVTIHSARPAVWGAFARATNTPNEVVRLVAPGTPGDGPASPERPRLTVQDGGTGVGTQEAPRGAGWSALLAIREELTAWDVDALAGADLVLMQPLSPMEAELAASVLGLSEMKHSLAGIRADLVTVVSQGTVRWTLVTPTHVELQLIGQPVRR